MEALLYDAARTAIRAFGKELRRYGVLVPIVYDDDCNEEVGIVAIDKETALAHVRAGGDIDELAKQMWWLHASDLMTPHQRAYFRGRPDLTAVEQAGFVVGGAHVRVVRVTPVAQAAAGGIPQ